MIKRILFSLSTGMLVGILFAAAPGVQAQDGPCFGYCQEKMLKNGCISDYAGCLLTFNENGNLDHVTCFYVNTCVTKPNNT